jgi:hypothetical protein
MPFMTRTVLALATVPVLYAASAGAQIVPREPDPAEVRVRLGPLWLNPTLALTNAGVDTNVFYEPDALTPERDFTITVTAQSDYWLRMGRTWVGGRLKEDLVWYQTYAAERSANQNHTIYWLAPLNRLSVSVSGNWINARERPGFEIDARSDRTELAGGGSVELRASSKTSFGARGERRKIEFDQGEEFLGRSLQFELNRMTDTLGLTMAHRLTPLTTISVEVTKGQDRFDFSPIRDSDSTGVNGAVTFAPSALISGSAQIGYRRFEPLDSATPGYAGSIASVSLTHVARGSTRLGLQIVRDVQYSFEIDQPYYLQTGFTATLAQQIYGPVDVEFRAGRYALAYRDRGGSGEASRVDRIRVIGGGVGYRLGRDLRAGFNVDRQTRISEVPLRPYEGFRYGVAVTYGL